MALRKSIEANPETADGQFQYASALSAASSTDKEGKVVAPPGMKEALEKYLQLEPMGQFADGAKGLLMAIGATIETDVQQERRAQEEIARITIRRAIPGAFTPVDESWSREVTAPIHDRYDQCIVVQLDLR